MASLIVSLLNAGPAQAGHRAVSLQANGTDSVTVNGQTTSYSWPGVTGYTDGPSVCDYEPQPYDECDASTINATITPKLTWTPDNAGDTSKAPTSVVVETYVDAGAESSDGFDTLDVSDGCNDPVAGDNDQLADDGSYYWQGGFNSIHSWGSWGAHWQVKQNPNPASTVTLDSITMSASGGGEQDYASTGVSLFVTAYPVIVIPSGAIQDLMGNWNILVGQNCIPYLSIPGLPSAITVGWPTWTVSGDTYTSFDIGSGQNTGQAIPFPNPNANISLSPPAENPTFYWKDSSLSGPPETIQGWANLYTDAAGGLSPNPNVPPSAEIGSVSASAKVQVREPEEYTTPPSSTPGTFAANPVLGTPGLEEGRVESATNGADGFAFAASVVTPSLFTAGGSSPGSWAWLQLVQVNEMQGSNGRQDGSPVLDSSFPYNTSGSAGNGVPGAPYTASASRSGNPVYNLFLDTPDFPYYNYQTAVVAADSFQLYVMYQPPDSGTGVNWVPLDVYDWAFNCDMTRPNVFSNWTPTPPGSVVYVGGHSDPSYPSWSSKYAP